MITGAGGRRTWSAEAKARILEETLLPGAVVSEVARFPPTCRVSSA
nr:transposase [Methylobacterium sp. WSM2598]